MPTGAQECIVPFFVVVFFHCKKFASNLPSSAPLLSLHFLASQRAAAWETMTSVFLRDKAALWGSSQYFSLKNYRERKRASSGRLKTPEWVTAENICAIEDAVWTTARLLDHWRLMKFGKMFVHTALCFLSITWPISDATYLFYGN